MVRLFLSVFFALFILAVPKESVGQTGQLAGLTEIKILVENLSRAAKQSGLIGTQFKDHILDFLQSKLPRLAVAKSGDSFIDVSINIDYVTTASGRSNNDFNGSILLQIYRKVAVHKTAKVVLVPVWTKSFSLEGPLSSAHSHVRDTLDDLLTKFAADWYRDNPSK